MADVTVATYLDLATASVARARLEAHGIRCHLANEHVGALADYSLGGVQLRVAEADAHEAAGLLEEKLPAPAYDDPDDGPKCPACDTRYARVERTSSSLLAAFFTRDQGRVRHRARCGKCHHVWPMPARTA